MTKVQNFTEGKIVGPLLGFTLPILFAVFLQAMYGAVDLAVVGWFATTADVSGVSAGSQIMQTITFLVNSIAVGTTVLLGKKIGQGKTREASNVIGGSVCLFTAIALAITVVMLIAAPAIARVMLAPREAFGKTVDYVRICSAGTLFIVAYNLLGSIFRGLGDSKTPLLAVGIACVCNIAGDLLFVAGFGMAAGGAALATVLSQALSVLLCLWIVKRRGLPFLFARKNVSFNKTVIMSVLRIGTPIALQDTLVSFSFLMILAIVNSLGLVASAGVGVAERLCGFIMLVPSAYAQSLSAFVAQNIGAARYKRARLAMLCGMTTSFSLAILLAYLSFFHGEAMAAVFARGNAAVMAAAADYLKAYAIDTLQVSFLFCFIGYFNGCGKTGFVMFQGIAGAFGVRIPFSWFMSRQTPVSLFHVGLATPCSTGLQIALCLAYFVYLQYKLRENGGMFL